MSEAEVWRKLFQHWPPKVPPRGLVITSFGEQFPFVGFLTAGDVILFERRTPDNLGGRKMLLTCSQIVAIKLTDPIKGEVFKEIGFKGELPEGS